MCAEVYVKGEDTPHPHGITSYVICLSRITLSTSIRRSFLADGSEAKMAVTKVSITIPSSDTMSIEGT